MKIYTKTGDKGKTSLFGGSRVPKYHIRIEAYGTLDELNTHIGLIRCQEIDGHTSESLLKIQNELFVIGAMLATPTEKEKLKSGKDRLNIDKVAEEDIQFLEREIDKMQAKLPEMTHFVLPGGHATVSFCHIARCVCRRAERLVVRVSDNDPLDEKIITYLNRLSDYLFVLARKLTYDLEIEEIPWLPKKKS